MQYARKIFQSKEYTNVIRIPVLLRYCVPRNKYPDAVRDKGANCVQKVRCPARQKLNFAIGLPSTSPVASRAGSVILSRISRAESEHNFQADGMKRGVAIKRGSVVSCHVRAMLHIRRRMYVSRRRGG